MKIHITGRETAQRGEFELTKISARDFYLKHGVKFCAT